MIVRRLKASGFMRYEELELAELPRGVIAIHGENEAGKTTIGEAIAFSIFGRTVRTENTDPSQAIHWDKDECRTEIEIEVPDKGRYVVRRRVGRRGEFEATLHDADGEPLAAEPGPVSAKLRELLGFDFSTFRYSFYVAQHELDLLQRDSRDNARRIVQDMLGITTLGRAREHLGGELVELSERTRTLQQDLAVAEALRTEALPIRDELAAHAHAQEEAERALGLSRGEESARRAAWDRAGKACAAARERRQALARLEQAVVASLHRQSLIHTVKRLHELERGAEALVARCEQAAGAESEREAARTAREQAEAVEREVQALRALVRARQHELERQLDPAGEGLGARQALFAAAQERAAGALKRGTVALVAGLVLLLGGGVAAVCTRVPAGEPALSFGARELGFPSVGVTLDLTPAHLTWPLAALALVGLLLTVLGALKRKAASVEGAEAEQSLASVRETHASAQRELEACRAFGDPPLAQLGKRVAPLRAPEVEAAWGRIQGLEGDVLERSETAGELVRLTRAEDARLQEAYRAGAGQLSVAKQAAARAREVRAELDQALVGLFPGGAPKVTPDPEAATPADAAALAAEVERASAQAAGWRVELEAAQDAPTLVNEAAEALRGAVEASLQLDPGARERYTQQSGIDELTRARDSRPAAADVRNVCQREREVLRDVFGDGELAQREEEAREAFEDARRGRIDAEAALHAQRARGEQLETGRKRLVALEQKIHGLSDALAPARERMTVLLEASQLLDELADSLRGRFGPAITRYVELVLPQLTQGRYRRVLVDENLEIKVYSPERGDYVRLIELSLGTADQVLLALRLGLARALIGSRGIRGGQFLFLDEPLVSADQRREQAFLELLRTFDSEFAQIFVSSPRALDSDLFALTVEPSREEPVHRAVPSA
ncbi:MAG: AAA family ATPase [Planctomycetota bacterium]